MRFHPFQRACESRLQSLSFWAVSQGDFRSLHLGLSGVPRQVDATLGSTHSIYAEPVSPDRTSATRSGQALRVSESPRRSAAQKTVSSSWPNPSPLKGTVMAEDEHLPWFKIAGAYRRQSTRSLNLGPVSALATTLQLAPLFCKKVLRIRAQLTTASRNRSICFHWRRWKGEMECRSAPASAVGPDAAAMRFDDRFADR